MYERFYDLRERPFSLTPNPDYLYLSPTHREALSVLRFGIETHAGFVVFTGQIGCGKTTVLQTMLRSLDGQTSVSRLVNTTLDARELVEAVMLDFGLEPGPGQSKPFLMRELAHYLIDQRRAGRVALLVIDEAQNLSLPALEEVRMLSNFETEKSKLIQVILVGQSSLREVLGRPELEQLRQRITVSCHLQALDPPETRAYINHRLGRAAIGAPLAFSRDVTDLIHQHSEGVPRKINVIADAVLLFGYGEERREIDVDLTRETLTELELSGVIAAPSMAGSDRTAATAASDRANVERLLHLQAREERVAKRETALAEQQQVLMKEYQLLRQQRTSANQLASHPERAGGRPPDAHASTWLRRAAESSAPSSSMASNGVPPPPRPGVAPDRPSTPPAAGTPAAASRTPLFMQTQPPGDQHSGVSASFWTRLRRGLFGAPKSVCEE